MSSRLLLGETPVQHLAVEYQSQWTEFLISSCCYVCTCIEAALVCIEPLPLVPENLGFNMSFFDDIGEGSIWDSGLDLFQKRFVAFCAHTSHAGV